MRPTLNMKVLHVLGQDVSLAQGQKNEIIDLFTITASLERNKTIPVHYWSLYDIAGAVERFKSQ